MTTKERSREWASSSFASLSLIARRLAGNVAVCLAAIRGRFAGGASITVCDNCSFGFGSQRSSAPLLSWSPDGKWVYVSLRPFPFGSSKTAVIPIKSGASPPGFMKDFAGEADFLRILGARLINQDNVSPGISPDYFVNARRSAKANLFRIYLLQ